MSTELTTFNVDDTPLGTVQHFIDTSTAAGKAKLYNALQNNEKISDHLGEVINAANVIAQRVQVQNDETGEVNDTVRIIIVGDDGTSYAATSPTLASAFNTLFGVFGTPDHWERPLPIEITEEKSRKGFRFFNVKIADVDNE